jgi:hypothetical protein
MKNVPNMHFYEWVLSNPFLAHQSPGLSRMISSYGALVRIFLQKQTHTTQELKQENSEPLISIGEHTLAGEVHIYSRTNTEGCGCRSCIY